MAGTPPPSVNSRAMLAVKSKNNLDDLYLKRVLTQFEKEKAISLLLIDHEKLDLREFLKNIKVCGSDELPEAQFLLQSDLAKRIAAGFGKDGSPLPGEEGAGGGGGGGGGAGAGRNRDDDDDWDQGVFKTNSPSNQHVHIDIYSKRNQYANLNWVKEYFDEEGYDLTKKSAEPSETCSMSVSRRPSLTCTDITYEQDSLNGDTSTAKARGKKELKRTDIKPAEEPVLTMREQVLKKLGITPRSTKDRKPQQTVVPRRRMHPRKRHSKPPSEAPQESKPKDPNDFMKNLLVQNSQKIGQRMKTPMEDRLNDFYKKVKTLIETEADLSNAELEKNWRTITEDVKKVLVESFAQDESAAAACNT